MSLLALARAASKSSAHEGKHGSSGSSKSKSRKSKSPSHAKNAEPVTPPVPSLALSLPSPAVSMKSVGGRAVLVDQRGSHNYYVRSSYSDTIISAI